MKTLIIYYSKSENTKIVAETLAHELSSDIIRVKDIKKRSGFFSKFSSSIDAFRESKTEITPSNINISDYDLIYIGTPTWASNPVPAIITLIDKLDLKGKDVVLFATMSNSGGKNAIKRMSEKVEVRGGRVIETFTLKTKDKNLNQIADDSFNIARLLDLSIYS
ncbi:MAG: flavodoxin [Methanobacteriaceae archaeon]|uniref:flavodoxin family protein n=1 Tax=unclassified Methanobrevibacter TaxID=2638681 RepID=UPI002A124DD7|nr:flavodoxin [Methanobacteriaceae archaeon]MDD3408949.1 flavodoxin [Methanobacteriaceae archaeon]MDD4594318.1 flavodoxin [Methanobacteriaceae archaeon]